MNPFLEDAMAAARAGGEILLNYFGRLDPAHISHKGPRDLVSVADRASEQKIMAHLLTRYPDHRVLAEESGGHGAGTGYRWLIDPLDGTTNFIHGLPLFAVSIALYHDSDPVAGVVYDPLRNELFAAEKGGGATLNSKPIQTSGASSLNEALLTTGLPFRALDLLDAHLAAYRAFFMKSGIRRTGSAALDLAYVPAGRFDGYWDVLLMPWDYAAGALIVEEAGGRVSGIFGESIESGSLAASAPGIHEEMRRVLKETFAPSPPTATG